jgi:branched-chain amino acid transport system ATP-binding protein
MVKMASMNVLLETVQLSRRFGGLEAVKPTNLRVRQGEIRAIIGTNGAGKTTLVNMISGRIKPTSGKVFFKGRDITRLKAYERVAIGIVYTFQIINIFKNLTVYDNVVLAVQRGLTKGRWGVLGLDQRLVDREAEKILSRIGLSDSSSQIAGTLPYGYQRMLELAMALPLKPELLILDEPTQGLSAEEIERVATLIKDLAKEVTILLIEHNIRLVLELADTVTVMDKGAIIAEGRPREIEENAEVQRVYLGI